MITVGHVNIEIIFYCIGNSQCVSAFRLQHSVEIWLIVQHSVESTASWSINWLILENIKKATLNINMPYSGKKGSYYNCNHTFLIVVWKALPISHNIIIMYNCYLLYPRRVNFSGSLIKLLDNFWISNFVNTKTFSNTSILTTIMF